MLVRICTFCDVDCVKLIGCYFSPRMWSTWGHPACPQTCPQGAGCLQGPSEPLVGCACPGVSARTTARPLGHRVELRPPYSHALVRLSPASGFVPSVVRLCYATCAHLGLTCLPGERWFHVHARSFLTLVLVLVLKSTSSGVHVATSVHVTRPSLSFNL